MAASPIIPNDRNVYRGLRNANWCRKGVVNYRAFMLRPATNEFPAETELSLGLSPQSAVDELHEHHGSAELSVVEVHSLPHNLEVREDQQDNTKAALFGLPSFSTEPDQRSLAMTMATDLATISRFVQAPAVPNQNPN